MNKNIVVLAMSTLPANLIPRRFAWEADDKEGYEYFGQLEPVSMMIRKKEGTLDKVIILATEKTREKSYSLGERKISAVEYYLERMGISGEDAARIIDVEESDFVPAIAETVKTIRNYWAENDGKVNLWIDTQGSFRNINLVLNAVITLLETDGIVPKGIYSMNYNFENKIQKIVDQTETYKIFHFVSGINEFTRSGRAEQLTDYYHHTGKAVPEAINIMRKIAEAIQMCNMNEFDKYLTQLRVEVRKDTENSEKLFEIFQDQIKRDYGKLLEDDCTGLDIVEWFYRKGFYQQAITYIESRLPKEWLIKKSEQEESYGNSKAIIAYDIDPTILETLKRKLNKKYEKDENFIIGQIGVECFWWEAICFRDKNTNQIRCSNLNNLRAGRKSDYANTEAFHDVKVKIKKDKTLKNSYPEELGTMKLTILRKNQDQVIDLLLLYKLLKSERNNFNHMSESNVRASREKLGETIHVFLKIGRSVYEDIC